jgi:alkanesulfonate monooxygenase SsuD/methylene tetrahydromethanopterin reductase-like flavin-dependent oxidoreductase (luciferase family)
MQFGLFSESGYRRHAVPADALEEDLREIVAADKLGFREAWIAEPNHVRANTVTNASLLMSKAAGLTKQIRFGSGIRQIPLHHPVDLVQEANMLDQVTRGRYIFGYGGTHLVFHDQIEMRGIDVAPGHDDTREMVSEGIDIMLRCWTSTEPFDFETRFWHGKSVRVLPPPYQQPHPPIASACSGSAETIELAARNGFIPLFGRGGDAAEDVREWGEMYIRAAEAAGQMPSRGAFHVTHVVYVGETDERARSETRESMTRALEQRKQDSVYTKRLIPPGGTLDDVTFDYMVDAGHYWIGSPQTVYERIRDYFEETGGFGTLLIYAGLPIATGRQRARSMRLLMEQVAPRLVDLDPDRISAGHGALAAAR